MNTHFESLDWGRFWPDFRQEVLDCLRQWLATGSSGALVGLPGAGKSNFLLYLSRYPELIQAEKNTPFTALVTIDLNHLVDRQPTTLYRLIVRGCWHQIERFPEPVSTLVDELFAEYKHTNDLFLAQTAVYELLRAVEKRQGRIVLLLDQFDFFVALLLQS